MVAAVPLVSVAQNLSGQGNAAPVPQRGDRPAGLASHLLGFAILLLCWQIALLSALLGRVIEPGHFVALHFTSCFALTIFVIWRAEDASLKGARAATLQMIAWSALAGPHGALVAIALSLRPSPDRTNIATRGDTGKTAHDRQSVTDLRHLHLAARYRRLRIAGAHRIRALVDVIADGSRSEKLEALAVVYRKYDPTMASVLKRALQDTDASVRVLAATVTATLNSKLSRNIGDCQAAAATRPDLARSFRELAQARLAYANSRLLEASQARAEAEAAIADLTRAAEIDPIDPDIAACLARVVGEWRPEEATTRRTDNHGDDIETRA